MSAQVVRCSLCDNQMSIDTPVCVVCGTSNPYANLGANAQPTIDENDLLQAVGRSGEEPAWNTATLDETSETVEVQFKVTPSAQQAYTPQAVPAPVHAPAPVPTLSAT